MTAQSALIPGSGTFGSEQSPSFEERTVGFAPVSDGEGRIWLQMV